MNFSFMSISGGWLIYKHGAEYCSASASSGPFAPAAHQWTSPHVNCCIRKCRVSWIFKKKSLTLPRSCSTFFSSWKYRKKFIKILLVSRREKKGKLETVFNFSFEKMQGGENFQFWGARIDQGSFTLYTLFFLLK